MAFAEAPHLVGEAGGMRFLPAHKHVFNLVRQLQAARARPMPSSNRRTISPCAAAAHIMRKARDSPTKLFPYQYSAVGPNAEQSALWCKDVIKIIPGFGHMTHGRVGSASDRASVTESRLVKDWPSWALMADIFTAEENRFFEDAGAMTSRLSAAPLMALTNSCSAPTCRNRTSRSRAAIRRCRSRSLTRIATPRRQSS